MRVSIYEKEKQGILVPNMKKKLNSKIFKLKLKKYNSDHSNVILLFICHIKKDNVRYFPCTYYSTNSICLFFKSATLTEDQLIYIDLENVKIFSLCLPLRIYNLIKTH